MVDRQGLVDHVVVLHVIDNRSLPLFRHDNDKLYDIIEYSCSHVSDGLLQCRERLFLRVFAR